MNIHTCLLIDDDTDDQELFALALEDLNANINLSTANNGEEGLQYLNKNAAKLPDVIFLDLNMPKMAGKECLKAIKADAKLNHIPVVIFTTSSDAADKAETLNMGAVDFITKPSRTTELTSKLSHFLKPT